LKVLVLEGDLDLTLDVDSSAVQLVFETLFVDAFEQTRAQCLVNLKRGIDDDSGNLVDLVGYWFSL
jgi:hypothetical protein